MVFRKQQRLTLNDGPFLLTLIKLYSVVHFVVATIINFTSTTTTVLKRNEVPNF